LINGRSSRTATQRQAALPARQARKKRVARMWVI
jgi:hypothetical protein